MFRNQREVLRRRIEEMQHTLETVEYKCWFYETAREARTVQAPKSMTEQEIPERFRTIRRELKGE